MKFFELPLVLHLLSLSIYEIIVYYVVIGLVSALLCFIFGVITHKYRLSSPLYNPFLNSWMLIIMIYAWPFGIPTLIKCVYDVIHELLLIFLARRSNRRAWQKLDIKHEASSEPPRFM
jgi:MFS-type transporter involved in bile tolerance (Atg22 family)